MSIQTDIDSLLGGGVSVFNLTLNVAGIIQNKKNVAIYTSINGQRGKNILEGTLGAVGSLTGNSSFLTGTGVVMSAEIVENSKLTEHPLENGEVLADSKVIQPTEINIQITLQSIDYKDIIAKIREYKDNRIMLRVETKFATYKNMQIVSIPCNLNANNISRITFNLRLREVLMMVGPEMETANVSDMDTVSTGITAGVEVENGGVFIE